MLAELVRATTVDVLTSRELDVAAVPSAVTIQRPRGAEHGDYATNVALVVAGRVGVAPRALAGWLADALTSANDVIGAATVAGPGFVNLTLTPAARARVVREVLSAGDEPAPADLTAGPAGPLDESRVRAAQYVHSRLAAIARNAVDLGIALPHGGRDVDLAPLTHPCEHELIGVIAEHRTAGRHRASLGYLEDVVDAYHRFVGACRVLPQGDEETSPLTLARLALCAATRQVLANGLATLGIPAPERM